MRLATSANNTGPAKMQALYYFGLIIVKGLFQI